MISSNEYRQRRARLVKRVHQPMVFTANDALQSKSDMAYPFVQEANFFYLTGLREARWKLFYDEKEWHLVKPSVSSASQLFNGTISLDIVSTISGIDSILTTRQFHERLGILKTVSKRIATLGNDPYKKYYDFTINPAQQALQRLLKNHSFEVISCRDSLQRMRAIKSNTELDAQRQAIDITVKTFHEVKKNLPRFQHEYEIEAVFNSAFRANGAEGHAYEPIVASGANACTLHYSANRSRLPKDGLVLIDIGAQNEGYTADITRTYALGNPSKREIEVHKAVQEAKERSVAVIKPGLTLKQYQKLIDSIMRETVYKLGLSTSPNDTASFHRYFPHAISHGLGIDVHESLGGYTEFKPGMVLTVEPGIYIPEEGIGVRIEDDILVTTTNNENLSAALSTAL